ncbi:hypothetical protein A6E03_06805 [Aliivibrio sp. 1S128]|nr:hypothetical protein A6E03_06805 [Aliivibrio sp. 1S128]
MLTLPSEMVPQVLNGERVVSVHYHTKNTLNLKEGENQLAITVGQIVSEDGKRRKFDSQPLLISFMVKNNEALSISYNKFRTMDEAKAFEINPVLSFTESNGKEKEYQWVQLNKGGLQGFRDYEREVADYNAQQDKVFYVKNISDTSPVQRHTTELQNTFLQLTAEQQQEFMQWAMRNLK